MHVHRETLPQASSPELYLADGGLETDLIFREGYDLPLFASLPLLDDPRGCIALRHYYRAFADVAKAADAGFMSERSPGPVANLIRAGDQTVTSRPPSGEGSKRPRMGRHNGAPGGLPNSLPIEGGQGGGRATSGRHVRLTVRFPAEAIGVHHQTELWSSNPLA